MGARSGCARADTCVRAQAGPAAGQGWRQFRHHVNHSGCAYGERITDELAVAWQYVTDGDILSSPGQQPTSANKKRRRRRRIGGEERKKKKEEKKKKKKNKR